MNIGKRIRTARKVAGISQEELARRAGMSLKGMGDIERGDIADPHYSSLSKIAGGLGVSVGELLEEPVPLGRVPDSGDRRAFEGIIAMDMTEFAQYAETLNEDALQVLRERIDAEGAQRHSTDREALQSLAIRSFIAGLDIQVRRGQTAPEQAREQVAALVAEAS